MIKRQISNTTIFTAMFIIISASFTRQLVDFVKTHLGKKIFIGLMGVIFISAGLIFLIFLIIRNRPSLLRGLLLFLVLIIGLILGWRIKIIQERMHILEYGLLGWLATRDLIVQNRKAKGIILVCVLVMIVGIIDEVFQFILPYRFGEKRDILFNVLGGIWGTTLYLLGQR